MKNFLSLKTEEYLDIAPKIFKNAKVLLSTAEDAALKNNYGVACSLTILGTEEYVKGIVILMRGKGVNVFKIKELRKILLKHNIKHETATLINGLTALHQIVIFFQQRIEKKRKLPVENKVSAFFKSASFLIYKVAAFRNDYQWWQGANIMKNNGLYVGYNEQVLLPENITEQIYSESKMQSDKIVKQIDELIVILNDDETSKKSVEMLNESLKIYKN